MNITVSFEVGYEDPDDLFAWLDAGIKGVAIKKKRSRKPMTAAEKKAFRDRMVKGQKEAAKLRKAEAGKKSKSAAKKKSAAKE